MALIKMTAEDVRAALRAYHPQEAWGFITEMANSVGTNATNYFDVFVVAYWSSLKYERRVYEVKVSRSDLKHELDNPKKREWALKRSNTYYFATPKGLFKDVKDVPPECGLVEVDENGNCRMVKKAPWRECEAPSLGFFLEACRQATKVQRELEDLRRLVQRRERGLNPYRGLKYHIQELLGLVGFETNCENCNPEPPKEEAREWWLLSQEEKDRLVKEQGDDEEAWRRAYVAHQHKAKEAKERREWWWKWRYHKEKLQEGFQEVAEHEKKNKVRR